MSQICPQVKAIVTRGECNRCNQDLVRRTSYCCDHIDCLNTCDWYGEPDHCALARDPDDAAKLNPMAHQLQKQMRLDLIRNIGEAEARKAAAVLGEVARRLLKWAHSHHPSPVEVAELELEYNKVAQRWAPGAIFKLQAGKRDQLNRPIPEVMATNDDARIFMQILMAAAKKAWRT